ncbi:hypothetical protein D9M68_578210 [compost metagenome]
MAPGRGLLVILCLLLSGCARGQGQPDLPYRAWYLGLLAPNYMEVWVESVDVVDRRGLVFERVSGGTVAIQTPPNNSGNPRGWPKRVGAGAGRNLPGIDLPEFIFVRWQSLAEPQTYHVKLTIPQWVRDEMLPVHSAYCHADKAVVDGQYRNMLTIGLAPGGIAKAWIAGPCLEPIEIGRFVGVVHKEGPYDGQSGGEYYFLSDESKAYIEAHGVPYGSW